MSDLLEGWLLRELKAAKEEVAAWPEWLKREAGVISKRRVRPSGESSEPQKEIRE